MKIIRCDRELETPHIDRTLRNWGHELILMPESINEDELCMSMTVIRDVHAERAMHL